MVKILCIFISVLYTVGENWNNLNIHREVGSDSVIVVLRDLWGVSDVI